MRRNLALLTLLLGLALISPLALADPPPSEEDLDSNLQVLFIDTRDAGDDPLTPGCHYHFGNDTCSAPEFFFSGDTCSASGKLLFEWTNTRCHEAEDDVRKYNCNTLCMKKKGVPGKCEVVSRYCRVPRGQGDISGDSARCVCNETGS